jgi:hydroxypyruvate reductase
VVHLTGIGLGGRNQEVALGAAALLDGMTGACVISIGSDGTDGPTDAAGGYADGDTVKSLKARNISLEAVFRNNDAYHALKSIDGLVMTGPTGTNVNDISVALLRP